MEFHRKQPVLDQLVQMEGGRAARQSEGICSVIAPYGCVGGSNQLEKLAAFFIAKRGNGGQAAAPRKSAHREPFVLKTTSIA
jgi:hypothetical protein